MSEVNLNEATLKKRIPIGPKEKILIILTCAQQLDKSQFSIQASSLSTKDIIWIKMMFTCRYKLKDTLWKKNYNVS